jgi:hypothetical protein
MHIAEQSPKLRVITITTFRLTPCFNRRMNNRLTKLVFVAIAIMVGSTAFADQIYKWTDENGNIHYTDRPSGNAAEQQMQVSYNRTDSTAVTERVDSYRAATDARRETRSEADEEERQAADELAETEARQAKCQDYRAKYRTMVESPRVYREDDVGERVYLDDTERESALIKAEEVLRKTCDS